MAMRPFTIFSECFGRRSKANQTGVAMAENEKEESVVDLIGTAVMFLLN
jgi:hypothetical protein